jgi:hypothetical protein
MPDTPGRMHYGDHRPETEWEPARYRTGPLVGAGRWVHLYAPVDLPPVGTLYTDDDAILGYMPADAMQHPNAPAMAHVVQDALLGAAALGTPASVVFDAWAERDGRGLAAGTVEHGDLRTLGG